MRVRSGSAIVGQIVTIRIDGAQDAINLGDYVRTKTGRVYEVVRVHLVRKGKSAGRYELRGRVQDDVPAGAKLHAIEWGPTRSGHTAHAAT